MAAQLGPIFEGQTRPSWAVTVKKSDNDPLDITSATFAGALVHVTSGNIKALTVGNYSIDDATAGQFSYAPDSGEVDEAGLWLFRTTITISSETYMTELEITIHSWAIS